MKNHVIRGIMIILSIIFFMVILHPATSSAQEANVRQPVDTVGFATNDRQMDSVMARIERFQGPLVNKAITDAGITFNDTWKTILSPHDDYAYVGYLYPALFQNLKAKTIILLGVAHKARQLNLENRIIFGSYTAWKAPGGNVPVSPVREELMKELPSGVFMVNDSMHAIEHSLEALVPFIQQYRPDAEIVPILVPGMTYDRTDDIAFDLAEALKSIAEKRNWKWGEDFAIVISSDAVHYGDEGWGGSNYAFMGADTSGYQMAVSREKLIIHTISRKYTTEHVREFNSMVLDPQDHTKYTWTWCGRYSVPMGLLASYYLALLLKQVPLTGIPVGYSTSIDHKPIPVEDIGMGVTAAANIRHWVGYAAIGYR